MLILLVYFAVLASHSACIIGLYFLFVFQKYKYNKYQNTSVIIIEFKHGIY